MKWGLDFSLQDHRIFFLTGVYSVQYETHLMFNRIFIVMLHYGKALLKTKPIITILKSYIAHLSTKQGYQGAENIKTYRDESWDPII